MPKIMSKYTATAKNEPAGSLIERIKPSAAIRAKYAELGKRRPQPKPVHEKVVTRPLSLAERLKLAEQFRDHTESRALLSRLTEQRRLLDRITEAGPSNEVPVPRVPTAPPHVQPDLSGLHFHKSKILKRIQEVMPLVEATYARLKPVFDRLLKEEKHAKAAGVPERVPQEISRKLWEWADHWDEMRDAMKGEECHKWTNTQWRQVAGLCKRIAKIYLKNVDSKLVDICKELVEDNFTFPSCIVL